MCLKNAQETKIQQQPTTTNSQPTNNEQPSPNCPLSQKLSNPDATWRSSTSHVDNVGSPVLCCSSWSRCLVAPIALQALGPDGVEIDEKSRTVSFYLGGILYGEAFLRDIYPSRNTIYIYIGCGPLPRMPVTTGMTCLGSGIPINLYYHCYSEGGHTQHIHHLSYRLWYS